MDQQQQSRWPPTRRQLLWAVGIVAVLTIAVLIGYRYSITLWDWIKLLIVPTAIAGAGLWFNRQQRERELEIARQQQAQELEIAERCTQDEALQAYLDGMAQLLTDKERPLYRSEMGDYLSSVARARTLTVLPRLDGERKARVVQFLVESGLIAKERSVLRLSAADLSGANLEEATLRSADLRWATLISAHLSGADLSGAIMDEADLRDADLRAANLGSTFLSGANLGSTSLSSADLLSTNMAEPGHIVGADLRWADLTGAFGWTEDQLSAAGSLQAATMPNGQKYEDWLKSKGSGEDGKNDGST